ncbi:putative Mitochondrial glycoprotein family protein [Quillaja saponaria]|uniref:Mitochondrial glycoprotein family protein n=1 Tax=Quillaja saponaria TaxID=32244 RepID=A0AAD7LJM1_QUISA|nr:putative Mitochondrial glycoprotein family protein [Quillaja saponaria]
MARLIRTAQRAMLSSPSCSIKTLTDGLPRRHRNFALRSTEAILTTNLQTRPYVTETVSKSPFEANILRILRNEIEYHSEYAPPQQPITKFNSFTVQDRPGEQWITIRGKYGGDEDVKIEVTMFDGCEHVPKLGDDSSGVDVHLHISLLVDISKGEGGRELEFVCSAWPDRLEVDKVYLLRRDGMLTRPYMGPDFRNLNGKLQKTFRQYLEERGVNNELSVFLHEYMTNKDKTELLRWLGDVKSFVEK